MYIEKIRIKNFRNIQNTQIHLCPSVNIFFGQNAQGKTNFLESIYTVLNGASFRAPYLEMLLPAQDLKAQALVELHLHKKNLLHKVALNFSESEKRHFVNEKKQTISTIRKEFSTILFSPESLSVIKESDKERRDLVDEVVEKLSEKNQKTLESFRRLLRQRNLLLKEFKDGRYEVNPKNILYLESLTEKYLEQAAELVVARLEVLQKIVPPMAEILGKVFLKTAVDISVDYVISDTPYRSLTQQGAYDAMYKRWLQLKSAEIKTGFSLIGPHKHDIRFLLNENDSRYYSSQGQQRLLILAFKMAQIGVHFDVHGTYPILLLDDVLSEIDEQKRQALMEALEGLHTQIFITSTETTVLRYLNRCEYAVFEVKNGEMSSKTGHQEEISV